MSIIHTYQKSPKKKPTAKERELKRSWEKLLAKYKPKKSIEKNIKPLSQPKPFIRETPYYPSLNSGFHDCTKKEIQKYTGTKMIGIGTLHKSNAVPIFTDDEAKDQANMRR
jgi:hypothetical protein